MSAKITGADASLARTVICPVPHCLAAPTYLCRTAAGTAMHSKVHEARRDEAMLDLMVELHTPIPEGARADHTPPQYVRCPTCQSGPHLRCARAGAGAGYDYVLWFHQARVWAAEQMPQGSGVIMPW